MRDGSKERLRASPTVVSSTLKQVGGGCIEQWAATGSSTAGSGDCPKLLPLRGLQPARILAHTSPT